MRKTITIKECRIIAESRGGRCLSKKYTNTKAKLLWECSEGHQWESSIGSVKHKKSWCKKCSGKNKKRKKPKYSEQNCIEAANNNHGKFIKSIDGNFYTNSKIHFECKMGHAWNAILDSVVNRGNWCPKCANIQRNKTITIEECRRIAKSNEGECLSEEYMGSKTKLKWQCKNGHIWMAPVDNIKNGGTWCGKCALRKYSIKFCNEFASKYNGRCLSETYNSIEDKYLWECRNEHRWSARLKNILEGQWCPFCKSYRNQNLLYQIIVNNIDSKAVFNCRSLGLKNPKTGRDLEVDIFIPSIKLAVEYDGRQHFEPVKIFGGEIAYKNITYRDKVKEKLIEKSNDINGLVRFNYKEKINTTTVINKIRDRGFIWELVWPNQIQDAKTVIFSQN